MKILKRLLLLIGFLPCFIIGGIWWITLGEDPINYVDSFIKWCTK